MNIFYCFDLCVLHIKHTTVYVIWYVSLINLNYLNCLNITKSHCRPKNKSQGQSITDWCVNIIKTITLIPTGLHWELRSITETYRLHTDIHRQNTPRQVGTQPAYLSIHVFMGSNGESWSLLPCGYLRYYMRNDEWAWLMTVRSCC